MKINWQYKDLLKLAQEVQEAQQTDDPAELASLYITLRAKLEGAEQLKTALQKMFDGLRFARFPEVMDAKGITMFKTKDGDKLELTSDIRVGVLEENRPLLFQWLRDRNSGDIIKETVNAQTLQAMVRRMFKEGKQDELPVVVGVDGEPLKTDEGKTIPVVKVEPYSAMKLTLNKKG